MLVVGPRWPFNLVVTCRSAASPAVNSRGPPTWFTCTDKKEYQIFLIYREILSRAVAKSYMRKGFLIYEEMRKYFTIYEEAVIIYDFATAPL